MRQCCEMENRWRNKRTGRFCKVPWWNIWLRWRRAIQASIGQQLTKVTGGVCEGMYVVKLMNGSWIGNSGLVKERRSAKKFGMVSEADNYACSFYYGETKGGRVAMIVNVGGKVTGKW